MRQPLDHDRVELYMDATPETLYAMIADVTRMPGFSPEILECTWLDGATEAAVGARFVARNTVGVGPSFRNKPVITRLDPGKAIAWARTEKFGGTVEWTYEFEPSGTGTRVVESYNVTSPIGRIGWFIIGTLFRQKGRKAILRKGMEQTLERIRTVAEAG
jgi:uncharacterized protein YndB with AHSA1/START domain